jgi:hypothetical protein
MTTQVIKDARFHILGYIDTKPDGSQVAKNAQFKILGYYDPRMDCTKDAQFHIIGYGNLLASLIH